MAEKTSTQLAQIISLLNDMKTELNEAKDDIRWLKEQVVISNTPRPKRAIITVPTIDEFEEETICLSVEDWARVKRGELVVVTTVGDFGGDLLRSHWEFRGGIGGTIKRDVEWGDGDIEAGYERPLDKDDVEEIDDDPSV